MTTSCSLHCIALSCNRHCETLHRPVKSFKSFQIAYNGLQQDVNCFRELLNQRDSVFFSVLSGNFKKENWLLTDQSLIKKVPNVSVIHAAKLHHDATNMIMFGSFFHTSPFVFEWEYTEDRRFGIGRLAMNKSEYFNGLSMHWSPRTQSPFDELALLV